MSVQTAGSGTRVSRKSINERSPVQNIDPVLATNKVHHIHFLEDGFTALQKVWYRGEELIIEEGSDEWNRIVDHSTGRSWITMTEDEQIDRFGKWLFRDGPWRGKGFDLEDPSLTEEDKIRLKAIEAKRGGVEPYVVPRKAKREPVAPKPPAGLG